MRPDSSSSSEPTSDARRQRAEATRAHLLASARAAFEERGYRATSIADIVTRAGTAPGTFYLYFSNKEDIFVEVLGEAIEELRRTASAPSQSDYSRDGIREAARRYLVAHERRRALWRCMFEGMFGSAAIERRYLELRDRFIGRIADNLRRGQADGTVRDDLDPELTARALGSMVEWFAFSQEASGGALHGAALDASVETLAAIWVGATQPVPAVTGQ